MVELQSQSTHATPEQVLEAGLSVHFKRPVRIARMESRLLGQGEADYPVSRLRVTLTSGEQVRVIFKRCAQEVDPEGDLMEAPPSDYMREVLTYRHLLSNPTFDAPAVYASVYDPTLEQYWLFIEDLGTSTLEGGDLEDFLAATRYLGTMHGTYAGREEELRRCGSLVEHGPAFYRALAAGARRNLQQPGQEPHLDRFDRLMQRFDSVIRELLDQPRTLLHGDFSSHNIAVQSGRRIRPIDWEWAAIGPVGWDLVRLYYEWQSNRSDFLGAYLEEFQRCSSVPLDPDGLERRFSLCEVVYRVWFLWAVPNRFPEPGFVDGLLREMQKTLSGLEAKPLTPSKHVTK